MGHNIITSNWSDYKLIDFGGQERLESFAGVTVIRPDVHARGNKMLSDVQWKKLAQAKYVATSNKAGNWQGDVAILKELICHVPVQNNSIEFLLKPTAYKHLGIFPEQKNNWNYIAKKISSHPKKQPKVLNLFAYTGGASLVSKLFGADVCHVDSIKSVVDWSRRNMELSHLDHIRWCVEDAFTFIQREVKRGKTYDGIIMDPPTFGLAKKGKRWKIENELAGLLQNAVKLLDRNHHFCVLNTYSPHISLLEVENFIRTLTKPKLMESGVLNLKSEQKILLPTGNLIRFSNY